MKIILGLICLLCITFNLSFCQDLPNIVPPSPESSSLFKFVETPVSKYDGIANVNIPIYTIQAKGLEIPISLNYHGRGFKVEEIASRVGLGWTLNYGGAISRQIRDGSDDSDSKGYLTLDFYSTFFTDVNTQNSIYEPESEEDIDFKPDFDPDLFFFNFPGHGGKFIFDQVSKKPLVQEFQDIIIEPIKNGSIIEGFKVIDEKGNQFFFGTDGTYENPVVDYEQATPYKFSGAMSILTAGGSHINFLSVQKH